MLLNYCRAMSRLEPTKINMPCNTAAYVQCKVFTETKVPITSLLVAMKTFTCSNIYTHIYIRLTPR